MRVLGVPDLGVLELRFTDGLSVFPWQQELPCCCLSSMICFSCSVSRVVPVFLNQVLVELNAVLSTEWKVCIR